MYEINLRNEVKFIFGKVMDGKLRCLMRTSLKYIFAIPNLPMHALSLHFSKDSNGTSPLVSAPLRLSCTVGNL